MGYLNETFIKDHGKMAGSPNRVQVRDIATWDRIMKGRPDDWKEAVKPRKGADLAVDVQKKIPFDRLAETRFDSHLLPAIQTLALAHNAKIRNQNPLEFLYRHGDKLVDDYTLRFISLGETRLTPDFEKDVLTPIEVGTIGEQKERQAARALELAKAQNLAISHQREADKAANAKHLAKVDQVASAVANPNLEALTVDTPQQVKDRIRELVGWNNTVRKTYLVPGQVQATEVIPHGKLDPLFCVRIQDDSGDARLLNSYFRIAFILAMIGRANDSSKALEMARGAAHHAGDIAYGAAIDGGNYTLAAMLFIGAVVYGRLETGFPSYSSLGVQK